MKAYGDREVYKMSGDWLPTVDEIHKYCSTEEVSRQDLLDVLVPVYKGPGK